MITEGGDRTVKIGLIILLAVLAVSFVFLGVILVMAHISPPPENENNFIKSLDQQPKSSSNPSSTENQAKIIQGFEGINLKDINKELNNINSSQ